MQKETRVGHREGERKWDWQEQQSGRNEPGVTHQARRERNRGSCREMERVGGRKREKREAVGSFLPRICLCGSVELFPLWKNFLSFSVCLFLPLHSSDFFLLSSLLCTVSQPPSFTSLCALSFIIFHPSLFLSMASTLCAPLPAFINLYSPRMHLFKACFTKTVQEQAVEKLNLWEL